MQYLAWNGQGTTSAERTVAVKDTLPPTLRLKSPMRMTHTCGSNWVDPGVTATDSYMSVRERLAVGEPVIVPA